MAFSSTSHAQGKEAAAKAALPLIRDGMTVGLGTGSTAAYFIQHLIEKVRAGLKIQAVATSRRSEQLAQEGGIPLLDINAIENIDLTIDGADEIDSQRRMIKGGGGALLREKIIATHSREMVVIVDESKIVDRLGKFPLPVEVIPFAWKLTQRTIGKLGYSSDLRKNSDGSPFLTDNQNYILDLRMNATNDAPELMHAELKNIPGVVETGLFLRLAGRVFIGHGDGSVELWS